MKSVFITGLFRSGTSLLEKLIHAHPAISIASQPFPSLYFYLKNEFNQKNKITSPYPITPGFKEGFSFSALTDFLKSKRITKAELDQVLSSLEKYPGQKSPQLFKLRDKVKEGTLIDFFLTVNQLLAKDLGKEGVSMVGSKEILGEEFIPYFLSEGSKVVLIIRDPRDVIVSQNYGSGKIYTGETRPLLYNLRLWRKSVAGLIYFRMHPDFYFVRYEDLIQQPELSLNNIYNFLNVENYNIDVNNIKDQMGKCWESNSSFKTGFGIQKGGVGRYMEFLDKATLDYINTVCYPELTYLGYSTGQENIDTGFISDYKDRIKVTHPFFDLDYTFNNKEEEQKRLQLLSEDASKEEQQSYFLFPEVYKILKETIFK